VRRSAWKVTPVRPIFAASRVHIVETVLIRNGRPS
jgi:hypothetical protein